MINLIMLCDPVNDQAVDISAENAESRAENTAAASREAAESVPKMPMFPAGSTYKLTSDLGVPPSKEGVTKDGTLRIRSEYNEYTRIRISRAIQEVFTPGIPSLFPGTMALAIT